MRRKTGLCFVGAFETEDAGLRRRFGVTVDLRLIPTTKVKPDTGSPFHGIEITDAVPMPFAFVVKRDITSYKLIKGKDEARPAEAVPRRAIVPLTGNARIKDKRRFYQTLKDKTRWLAADDIAVVAKPPTFPDFAEKGEKWIDISLVQQTLVLYEGKRPIYATLVCTGRDRLGDPKETLATPQGRISPAQQAHRRGDGLVRKLERGRRHARQHRAARCRHRRTRRSNGSRTPRPAGKSWPKRTSGACSTSKKAAIPSTA